MAEAIFYVCFDGHKVNWISFFLTHFLCSTHLVAIWLKEEPSKVSWLLSFHTFLLYTLYTIQYTRTDCSRNDIRTPSLPNVLAKKMSTYYIYPLHSSFFLFLNSIKCQDTLNCRLIFFCSHRRKRWIVCFVKSWNSLNIVSHALRHRVFLSHIHFIWLSF